MLKLPKKQKLKIPYEITKIFPKNQKWQIWGATRYSAAKRIGLPPVYFCFASDLHDLKSFGILFTFFCLPRLLRELNSMESLPCSASGSSDCPIPVVLLPSLRLSSNYRFGGVRVMRGVGWALGSLAFGP